MILRNIKFFIGISILTAYVSIGVFGLFQFSHNPEMPMEKCPYTQSNFAVCENTLNHIDDWQQFSNTIFTPLFVFSLLALGVVMYLIYSRNLFNRKHHLFYKWKLYLDNKKPQLYLRKITRWLSLFENSPSVFRRV